MSVMLHPPLVLATLLGLLFLTTMKSLSAMVSRDGNEIVVGALLLPAIRGPRMRKDGGSLLSFVERRNWLSFSVP